jgi:hypothetical protein
VHLLYLFILRFMEAALELAGGEEMCAAFLDSKA